jgi:hypothetical protein
MHQQEHEEEEEKRRRVNYSSQSGGRSVRGEDRVVRGWLKKKQSNKEAPLFAR